MAGGKKSKSKKSVSSKSKRRKANAKLGYGQVSKNVTTLRKLEAVNQEEKETI
jgi:hypothetical protein